MDQSRRSFLKKTVAFLAVTYVVPTALITVEKTGKYYTEIEYTSENFALGLDEFTKRFIEPAVQKLAGEIDNYITLKIGEKYAT